MIAQITETEENLKKKHCSTKHVSDLCGVQSELPLGAAHNVQQAAQFVYIYTAPLPTALPAACTPLHTHVTVCMLQAEYGAIFLLSGCQDPILSYFFDKILFCPIFWEMSYFILFFGLFAFNFGTL